MANVKKSLKQLKDKVFQSKQSLLVTILILGGISWGVYKHFQEPADEASKTIRMIEIQEEVIKMGKLNDEKWTIIQHKRGEAPVGRYKKQKRNESIMEMTSSADVVVGKNYAATYNKEHVEPETISIDERQREQRTVQFELVIYKLDWGGSREPISRRISLMTPDRQMMVPNANYRLKGFTEEDKYLVIQGSDVYGQRTFYYFEMNGGELKTERVVEEEDRYQEPPRPSTEDYKKYYSEEVQRGADIWPTIVDPMTPMAYLASTGSRAQPNSENNFIKKYPEIKEYYGKGTRIIINYADHDFTQEELIEDLRSGYVTD